MATVRLLFFFGTAFFALAKVGAAPKRYDQRQDGDFNFQAKLDNFLLVAIYPGSSVNSDRLSDLAWQFIQSAATARSKEQGLTKSSEAGRQEEPYSVEIIQIDENHPDKENSVRRTEGADTGTSSVLNQQATLVSGGQTEKAERVARSVKNFDFPKSREVPAAPGYFVNVRKTSRPKTGDGSRARNVVGNARNSDDKPGTSLKKGLPRRRKEDVALPSSNADKNDVSSFAEEEQQELKLLGDGIENCGPGRRRDASGVCRFDGSADSL